MTYPSWKMLKYGHFSHLTCKTSKILKCDTFLRVKLYCREISTVPLHLFVCYFSRLRTSVDKASRIAMLSPILRRLCVTSADSTTASPKNSVDDDLHNFNENKDQIELQKQPEAQKRPISDNDCEEKITHCGRVISYFIIFILVKD